MELNDFKGEILDYLKQEQELTRQDIIAHGKLSDEEKVSLGYLVQNAVVKTIIEDTYELFALENYSKFRIGDKVFIIRNEIKQEATIIENTINHISIKTSTKLSNGDAYDILIKEIELFDPIINIIDRVEDGMPGSFYLKELCKIKEPKYYRENELNFDIDKFSKFNTKQQEAIKNILKTPSLYCIQGPPGTGKTDVLAFIAKTYSDNSKNVLIISNTHQAVNNALNQVYSYNVTTIKIGEPLKGLTLKTGIKQAKSYNEYKRKRGTRRSIYKGEVVGMTLHGAIVELGLLNSGFYPDVILVDEASQISLAFGVALGLLNSRSVVLIGDDRQMPPIFHQSLVLNPLSVSIFTYVSEHFPTHKTILNITYRMNSVITNYVSKHFYEPYGIKLISNREPKEKEPIEIVTIPVENRNGWQEYNSDEAMYIAQRSLDYSKNGYNVAVVTPFRKQVNCINSYLKKVYDENNISTLPIVDTVERLQGQSVDVIIVSTVVSDESYYQSMKYFILDPHRLNVMFSRSKEKILITKSSIVEIPKL